MRYFYILLILFHFESSKAQVPIILGEQITFDSKILNETRKINIYLPDNYNIDTSFKYPVIYLLDGSLDEDFKHVVGLVNFANYEWIDWIPKSIVVGIENIDRKKDFTFPTSIEKDKINYPTTGHSENFISFLEHELINFVDSTYRTNHVNSIIGQSLGGLLATEILIKKTNLFDGYFIISPSIWWNQQSILKNDFSKIKHKQIYIAVGNEGKVMKSDAKSLYKKINSSNRNNKIMFNYLKEYSHGDILHTALIEGFQFIKSLKK